MIKEVYPNIYQCKIPLTGSSLGSLNSYIVCSDDKSLIIDTGFNTNKCKDALIKNLNELEIDINSDNISLFITHLHSDHSGLAPYFNANGVDVYMSKKDGNMRKWLLEESNYISTDEFNKYAKMIDMQRDFGDFNDNPDYKYRPGDVSEFEFVKEGDVFKIGDFNFEVVDIPGHTLGHIGLYDKNKKIFFCGDHILDEITPNITFWGFDQDILSIYKNSLNKIYDYDIEYLFTAHRNIIKDHKKRIDEIFKHHDDRLYEAISIMKDGNSTVKDIAKNMHWNSRGNSWSSFDELQKAFAVLETMAHLEHLVFTDKAKKIDENGTLHYKLY